MGCRRSPFLNMGTTLAVVQSIGIVPCFNEAWKNSVNMGVSSSASVLGQHLCAWILCRPYAVLFLRVLNLVGMWSGPVALCSLSVHSNL